MKKQNSILSLLSTLIVEVLHRGQFIFQELQIENKPSWTEVTVISCSQKEHLHIENIKLGHIWIRNVIQVRLTCGYILKTLILMYFRCTYTLKCTDCSRSIICHDLSF